MKKILALVLASAIVVSSSFTVFATDTTANSNGENVEGSRSVTAEDIKELEDKIDKLTNKINKLTKAVQAGNSSGGGRKSPSPAEPISAILKRNNAVAYGGNTVAQGGHVEINGGKSNVTFVLTPANGGIISSANGLASGLGGTLINCFVTSSPGVAFSSAKCNFYCRGVNVGDNLAVYQQIGRAHV